MLIDSAKDLKCVICGNKLDYENNTLGYKIYTKLLCTDCYLKGNNIINKCYNNITNDIQFKKYTDTEKNIVYVLCELGEENLKKIKQFLIKFNCKDIIYNKFNKVISFTDFNNNHQQFSISNNDIFIVIVKRSNNTDLGIIPKIIVDNIISNTIEDMY